MVEINDGRHFKNPYQDYVPGNQLKVENTNIPNKLVELLHVLNSNFEKLSSSDVSMYTGLSGVDLFYCFLSHSTCELLDKQIRGNATECLEKLLHRCLRHIDMKTLRKNISVFTSPVGPLCLGALSAVKHGTENAEAKKFLEQILSASNYALDVDSGMPDEALYGRTGYLNCLVTLKEHNFDIPVSIVSSVTDAILKSGQNTANAYKLSGRYDKLMHQSLKRHLSIPPLMFEWYNECYLGAAHGFTGILTTLLKVYRLFPGSITLNSLNQLILPTVDWMSQLQLSNGNWLPSLGDSENHDILVHWCHGATGVIPLMLSAYKITGENKYLKCALDGGETVWTRGLLHKGCGLCHGSAGSGFALLEIYQTTQDPKYLYRAMKFAEWCTDCFKNATRVADCPYSLMEGLSGTLYFLVGILDPVNSKFPLLSGL
uniref:LanC-like protein 1 n=1 Tax=Schistosoma japonicum TaxID=6182 RepID=C1LHN7_SCHJA|nr:LanC-like protein 1 [Schistosoma japonicum]